MAERIKQIPLNKLLAFGALVILYIFFAATARGFFSWPTTLNILSASYFVGFLAIGVTFVIITGGIDLSIGTVMICAALVGGQLHEVHGLPLWASLIVIVLVGTLFGLANGLMVTKLKLPPFIATLGTMMVALGFGSIFTNIETRRFLAQGDNAWFRDVFMRSGSFPTGALFLGAFFIIALVLLNKTKFGRYLYAIGSNEEAVRLSGVNADFWKCMAYVFGGFAAGFAAIMYAASYTSITPQHGQGYELQAIAAVVIGGTSLAGGVGSVTGTLIGVFIMSVLRFGLPLAMLPAPYQLLITGLVVIGAVLMDIQRNKRANQVKKVA